MQCPCISTKHMKKSPIVPPMPSQKEIVSMGALRQFNSSIITPERDRLVGVDRSWPFNYTVEVRQGCAAPLILFILGPTIA